MLPLYILFAALWLPGPLLTLWNIWNVVSGRKNTGSFEAAAFAIGIFLSLFLYNMWDPTHWDQEVYNTLHEPFSAPHLETLVIFMAVGFVSYAFLRSNLEKARPLGAVVSMAGICIGILVNLAVILQLYGSVDNRVPFQNLMFQDVLLMMLVPFNYLLLAVKLLIQAERRQRKRWRERRAHAEERGTEEEPDKRAYKNSFLNGWNRALADSRSWLLHSLLLALPLTCVLVGILLFLGQRPDSLIRVFTDTSDWTFSTKISPFPAKQF